MGMEYIDDAWLTRTRVDIQDMVAARMLNEPAATMRALRRHVERERTPVGLLFMLAGSTSQLLDDATARALLAEYVGDARLDDAHVWALRLVIAAQQSTGELGDMCAGLCDLGEDDESAGVADRVELVAGVVVALTELLVNELKAREL